MEIKDIPAQNKTRVLIIDSSNITDLVLANLLFNGKEVDFKTEHQSDFSNNDFFILQTKNFEEAKEFNPNIVLITEDFSSQNNSNFFESVVSGGVVIFNEEDWELVKKINSVENFFRKIPYKTNFEKIENNFSVETVLGQIPLEITDEKTVKNLEGAKLLCQQFGVMEEEFYEAAIGFQ